MVSRRKDVCKEYHTISGISVSIVLLSHGPALVHREIVLYA